MKEAVIVGAVRTPIGKRGGALCEMRPDDLAAMVLSEAVKRSKVPPMQIEDVILGCNTQEGEQSLNIARLASLIAGFPETIAGTTVDRQCGSGQQAVNFAAQAIMSGSGDLMIAGGVESMTRVPLAMDMSVLNKALFARFNLVPQGISAEKVASKYGISRIRLDEYSLESHLRAISATDKGLLAEEIMPVQVPNEEGIQVPFEIDECPRRDTSFERLSALKPVFTSGGKITAGNSSGIADGAAAVVISSREKAEELGVRSRARIVSTAVAGVDPVVMLDGTIPAAKKALQRAGLTVQDIDLWEVNEAFAPVPIATAETLGIDCERMNVYGGAIALGHPLGCSGARLITTLVHEMERRNVRYGLSTLCIGFGQGIATIIER